MNILISACLIGLYCRYDGKIKDYPTISKLFNRPDITLIPCCPEQAGGLPTPRMAAERCGQQVKTCDDRNVTERSGVTAQALSDMGVRIYGESEIDILTDSLLP